MRNICSNPAGFRAGPGPGKEHAMEDNRLEELCRSVGTGGFPQRGPTAGRCWSSKRVRNCIKWSACCPRSRGGTAPPKGKWVEHRASGGSSRAEQAEQHLPAGSDAILRYLSSGAVKGIGVATAARIVEKFGDETLRILEEEPGRLAEIKGITAAKAKAIGEAFARPVRAAGGHAGLRGLRFDPVRSPALL